MAIQPHRRATQTYKVHLQAEDDASCVRCAVVKEQEQGRVNPAALISADCAWIWKGSIIFFFFFFFNAPGFCLSVSSPGLVNHVTGPRCDSQPPLMFSLSPRPPLAFVFPDCARLSDDFVKPLMNAARKHSRRLLSG